MKIEASGKGTWVPIVVRCNLIYDNDEICWIAVSVIILTTRNNTVRTLHQKEFQLSENIVVLLLKSVFMHVFLQPFWANAPINARGDFRILRDLIVRFKPCFTVSSDAVSGMAIILPHTRKILVHLLRRVHIGRIDYYNIINFRTFSSSFISFVLIQDCWDFDMKHHPLCSQAGIIVLPRTLEGVEKVWFSRKSEWFKR